jgi:hypothetical protein
VYVTEHVPVALSVQLSLPLNVPAPLDVNVTVPVGTLDVPPLVSVTVAVQVVELFTGTAAGTQSTVVEVDRFVATRVVVPKLPRWIASPP